MIALVILGCLVMVLTPKVSFYGILSFTFWVASIAMFPTLVLALVLYKRI